MIRGSVPLPHGTGKQSSIAVFVKDEFIDQCKEAGERERERKEEEEMVDEIDRYFTFLFLFFHNL